MTEQTVATVTLGLSWSYFDPPGKPHHRSWSLVGAGVWFGTVSYTMAGWTWNLNQYDYDETGSGLPSREAAQEALLAVVLARASA